MVGLVSTRGQAYGRRISVQLVLCNLENAGTSTTPTSTSRSGRRRMLCPWIISGVQQMAGVSSPDPQSLWLRAGSPPDRIFMGSVSVWSERVPSGVFQRHRSNSVPTLRYAPNRVDRRPKTRVYHLVQSRTIHRWTGIFAQSMLHFSPLSLVDSAIHKFSSLRTFPESNYRVASAAPGFSCALMRLIHAMLLAHEACSTDPARYGPCPCIMHFSGHGAP